VNVDKAHEQLAVEIHQVASSIQDARHLRDMLGQRGVSTRRSQYEEDRTIELQVLDDDGETIEFAVFSDGPSGVFGIGGTATIDGTRLGPPTLYEGGVPVRSISIPVP
jgi:hypothetical protein